MYCGRMELLCGRLEPECDRKAWVMEHGRKVLWLENGRLVQVCCMMVLVDCRMV